MGTKQKLIERLLDLLATERQQHASEREAWATERVSLLNRLQAPEIAAYEATGEPSDVPLYVPETDAGWNAYVEERSEGKAL